MTTLAILIGIGCLAGSCIITAILLVSGCDGVNFLITIFVIILIISSIASYVGCFGRFKYITFQKEKYIMTFEKEKCTIYKIWTWKDYEYTANDFQSSLSNTLWDYYSNVIHKPKEITIDDKLREFQYNEKTLEK